MIKFIGKDEAVALVTGTVIDGFGTTVSVDTVTTCDNYKRVCERYPDFDKKYRSLAADRVMKAGYSISFIVEAGVMVFILFIKEVDKYQANINDIQRSLSVTLNRMTQFGKSHLLLTDISTINTKLSNQILIPAIVHETSMSPDITISFINTNCEEAISDIGDSGMIIKTNEWKQSWMLSQDDVLFAGVLYDLNLICNGIKLSKSRMLTLFKLCNDEGLYSTYTFAKGPYGWYFKEFMMKLSGLINHGILMDAEHFSTSKRTDYRIGPSFQILSELNQKYLFDNRVKIRTISLTVREKLAEIKKETYLKTQEEKGEGNVSTRAF